MWLGGIGVPETDLVLPEHLKGKLSLDEWRVLINLYLLRNKAYNSGRMSRILGTMALGILAVLAALLAIFVIFVGKLWGPVLVFPAWTPGNSAITTMDGEKGEKMGVSDRQRSSDQIRH